MKERREQKIRFVITIDTEQGEETFTAVIDAGIVPAINEIKNIDISFIEKVYKEKIELIKFPDKRNQRIKKQIIKA